MRYRETEENDGRAMRLTIGQLSHAFCLSNEAVRFYERKGLVVSARDAHNGYRYFDQTAIQRIGNIKRMQNQSFTLEEIERCFRPGSDAALLESFEQKRVQLERESAYAARMLSFTTELVQLLKLPRCQPVMVPGQGVFLKSCDDVSAFWEEALNDPALRAILSHMPLSSFSTIVERGRLTERGAPIRRGLIVACEDADLLGLRIPDGFRQIPAGLMLRAVFRMEEGRFTTDELISPFLKAMRAQGLVPTGDLFTRQLVSYTAQNKRFAHIVAAYLPVRQIALRTIGTEH